MNQAQKNAFFADQPGPALTEAQKHAARFVSEFGRNVAAFRAAMGSVKVTGWTDAHGGRIYHFRDGSKLLVTASLVCLPQA